MTTPLPHGWTNTGKGFAAHPDPVFGGIIDNVAGTDRWFVIFHHDELKQVKDLPSREKAIDVFMDTIRSKQASISEIIESAPGKRHVNLAGETVLVANGWDDNNNPQSFRAIVTADSGSKMIDIEPEDRIPGLVTPDYMPSVIARDAVTHIVRSPTVEDAVKKARHHNHIAIFFRNMRRGPVRGTRQISYVRSLRRDACLRQARRLRSVIA